VAPAVAVGWLLLGYAAGAIPGGVILGCWRRGTDLRTVGSGGTGTTNAYRILGWKISLAVLVLDFLKGLLPVVVAAWFGAGDWLAAAVAVAAVVGHCWSPWLHLHGGKGMATSAGAAAGLAPWILVVFVLMLAIVVRYRYVSLASLAGGLAGAALAVGAALIGREPWATAVAVSVMAGIIFERHHDNIARLRAHTERKLAWPPGSVGPGEAPQR
jgi:glycerol-3-phosphate acyltransferase PlsY